MKDFEIAYIEKNGYFYPDLKLPKQTDYAIGKYGLLHLDYLKKHRKATYTSLLLSGKLNEYLHEIDCQMRKEVKNLTAKIAKQRGITEALKQKDPLRWVQEMNNAKNAAEETVMRDYIPV